MESTMQEAELLVSGIFRHGAAVHADSRVHHYRGDTTTSTAFSGLAERTERLAAALAGLGIGRDDVAATLACTPAHLAAYFAVPGMGAVLHTLNLRLHDDQPVYTSAVCGWPWQGDRRCRRHWQTASTPITGSGSPRAGA